MPLKTLTLVSAILFLFSFETLLFWNQVTQSGEITTQTWVVWEKKWNKILEREASFYLALKKPLRLNLFSDDASLFRFVGKSRPLTSRTYKPENLLPIAWKHIDEAWRIGYLREDAKRALLLMAADFEKEFKKPLVVISGYRSAAYQQRMWDLGQCTSNLCAPPGYSEHQLGLAIDVFEASTESDILGNRQKKTYIDWIKKYGHLYGWHQSYQKGPAIDGYDIEPWHWRYIWKEMATRLKRLGWTFTEYVDFQESIQRR